MLPGFLFLLPEEAPGDSQETSGDCFFFVCGLQRSRKRKTCFFEASGRIDYFFLRTAFFEAPRNYLNGCLFSFECLLFWKPPESIFWERGRIVVRTLGMAKCVLVFGEEGGGTKLLQILPTIFSHASAPHPATYTPEIYQRASHTLIMASDIRRRAVTACTSCSC